MQPREIANGARRSIKHRDASRLDKVDRVLPASANRSSDPKKSIAPPPHCPLHHFGGAISRRPRYLTYNHAQPNTRPHEVTDAPHWLSFEVTVNGGRDLFKYASDLRTFPAGVRGSAREILPSRLPALPWTPITGRFQRPITRAQVVAGASDVVSSTKSRRPGILFGTDEPREVDWNYERAEPPFQRPV